MEMNSTTEGLYLTNSSKAFLLPKAENQIKIIDDFILVENDFSKQEFFNSISRTYRKANQKFCYLYLTYIKMFAKMEDKFMKFQDFYGNEAVLYSSHNTIFIPSCVDLTEIDVLEETKICYQDIPVQFNNNNRTISAFLSTDNIKSVNE